jgi:hypothetical protein
MVTFKPLNTRRYAMVTFKPLNDTERKQLGDALRANADKGEALHMDPKTTGFVPHNRIASLLKTGHQPSPEDEISDEETINAIRSVPCHY